MGIDQIEYNDSLTLGDQLKDPNTDRIFQKILDDQSNLSNWKKCCRDKVWYSKPHTNRYVGPTLAKELKTYIDYMSTPGSGNLDDFIAEYGLNKTTLLGHFNWLGTGTYSGIVLKTLLKYDVNIENLIKYIISHPEEKKEILDCLKVDCLPKKSKSDLVNKFLKKNL